MAGTGTMEAEGILVVGDGLSLQAWLGSTESASPASSLRRRREAGNCCAGARVAANPKRRGPAPAYRMHRTSMPATSSSLPAPVGREHGTPFDAAGGEAGTVAQPQPEVPRRRTQPAAQQRGLWTERQDLDTQGPENERHLGFRPAVLMETGRDLRDIHRGHRRAGAQRFDDDIGARLLQNHGEHRRCVQDGSRQRLLRGRFRPALGDELVHHARVAPALASRDGTHPLQSGIDGLQPDVTVVHRHQQLLAGADPERLPEPGRHDDPPRRVHLDAPRPVIRAKCRVRHEHGRGRRPGYHSRICHDFRLVGEITSYTRVSNITAMGKALGGGSNRPAAADMVVRKGGGKGGGQDGR